MLNLTAPLLLALTFSGFLAGIIGALVGIGGGLILVPLLVLGFGLDIKIAVATSLIAVIASSTTAGSVYIGKGLTNMRLGMCLEIATTLGGISGSLIAVFISAQVMTALFSVLMLITSILVLCSKDPHPPGPRSSEMLQVPPGAPLTGYESSGQLGGAYYDPLLQMLIPYRAVRLPLGGGVSFLAGILSGMLGVGGGFMKVPAMTLGMNVPIKVAAATSNFMIGVTAVSSLFVYFARGLVYPLIAAPIAVGVIGGSLYGTVLSQRISPKSLRRILSAILVGVALQMSLKTLGVSFGE